MLLTFSSHCYSDTNMHTATLCSEDDNYANEFEFQTNLKHVLNALVINSPLHNGFYKTTAGKRSQRVYGLVQCRGDTSAKDCTNCTRNAIKKASDECPKGKEVSVWFKWCFLRYSNISFFGELVPTAVGITNDTNYDDPSMVSKGLDLMGGLAYTVPKETLMFQTAVLNAGQSGKRYGMAQCNRDISRINCGKCLNNQLVVFKTTIGNKRGWEIYGGSCFMWYHDFQFYFNFSTSSNEG